VMYFVVRFAGFCERRSDGLHGGVLFVLHVNLKI
jgi:hypothetical protein